MRSRLSHDLLASELHSLFTDMHIFKFKMSKKASSDQDTDTQTPQTFGLQMTID